MQTQRFEPVEEIHLESCQVEFKTRQTQPWNSFKGIVEMSSPSPELQITHEQGVLKLKKGSCTLHLPLRASLSIFAEQCQLSGHYPYGHLKAGQCQIIFNPKQNSRKTSPSSYLQHCCIIFGMAMISALLFSPFFSPLPYLDWFILLGASSYIGLKGEEKSAQHTSIILAILSLIGKDIYIGKSLIALFTQGHIENSLQILSYILLWGLGKKIKDRYRQATA